MENIKYPKRAIITVGKPDGHKQIHIGHLAGGLINSDIFARFLRNRIGKENVLFFSGTECYGTAVYNEYLKNREQFKSIQDYIYFIHLQQKAILDKFKISLDGFFCDISDIKLHYIHSYLCQRFADCLFANGDISEKNEKILIDRDTGDFLNYRQIRYKNGNKQFTGKKYSTENVENMISSSSQKTPLKREVKNYFIKFSNREKKLIQLFDKKYQYISKYITNVLKEKREDIRLTSNSKLGINIRINNENKKLWNWIDSLIAPISYTMRHLFEKNRDFYNWAQWWCDENSDIFHFMAEDNVYFYTVVENFLIQSWNEKSENKINYPNYFLIPIPIPNTTAHIDLGYVVMAIFAYLYGPIAGGLIGGMGRFLEDMILFGSIGSPGWLIASILMGMLIGLTFKFTQKGDNPQIALMIQIILILIINAVLLIGLSPFISSLWHGVPYITKLPSGLSAFLTNSFAIIVIGIPIGRILEKMLKKS